MDKLFISPRLSGELNISNVITCLYRTVLEIDHLFHAESALNFYLKNSSPPMVLNCDPLIIKVTDPDIMYQLPWELPLCSLYHSFQLQR